MISPGPFHFFVSFPLFVFFIFLTETRQGREEEENGGRGGFFFAFSVRVASLHHLTAGDDENRGFFENLHNYSVSSLLLGMVVKKSASGS